MIKLTEKYKGDKMTMKKIICLLLTCVMLISLCACGAKNEPVSAPPTDDPLLSTPEPVIVTPPPAPIPTLVATPAPTPEPIVSGSTGSINITKHPSGETIPAGGKTWFIAHADNADKLVWQMVDKFGGIYSLENAMAANPGLKLEVLDNDTIAVSNVPQSVDGWSVIAIFSNASGSVATQGAKINILSVPMQYQSVLDLYKSALENGVSEPDAWSKGYSEMAGYANHAGYALVDLDGNGVQELIVAGTGSDNNSGNIIYEIDTIVNGNLVNLCTSHARDRFYLMNDNRVMNWGSGGAAYDFFNIYNVIGGTLDLIENLHSDLDEEGYSIWYYTNYNDTGLEEPLAIEVAQELTVYYQDNCTVPKLVQFA